MRCITALYPNTVDAHFDFDYYNNKHRPMIEQLYGKGIASYEVRRGVAGINGKLPPYIAVCTIWIGDQAAFDQAAALHSSKVMADVANFTGVVPIIQFDEAL